MEDLPNRVCINEECDIEFTPAAPRQRYHDRACFKDAWKKKQRTQGFPKFRCPECGFVSQLNINPKTHLAFFNWSCKCGHKPL